MNKSSDGGRGEKDLTKAKEMRKVFGAKGMTVASVILLNIF